MSVARLEIEGSAGKPATSKRRSFLLALLVGALTFKTVSQVSAKVTYNAYGQRYVFFRDQVTNFLFDIEVTLVIIVRAVVSPDFRQTLLSNAKRFHPCRLLIPALLDGLADFLRSVGGPGVPGSWTVLLGQTGLFFIMLWSSIFLQERFTAVQISGAVLTVLGACLAILPKLLGATGLDAGCVIIFFSSDIPATLGATYKGFAFKRGDLDIFYMLACISWAKLLVTWCYLPLLGLPAFGGLDMSALPGVLSNGAACFFGSPSTPIYDAAGHVTGHCSGFTTVATLTFSLSFFTAEIFLISVLKVGSASLSGLAVALTVPVADVLFSLPSLMGFLGLKTMPFSLLNVGGVVLVMVGFFMYVYKSPSGTEADLHDLAGSEVSSACSLSDSDTASGTDAD